MRHMRRKAEKVAFIPPTEDHVCQGVAEWPSDRNCRLVKCRATTAVKLWGSIILGAAFLYILRSAALNPLTHDEAISFFISLGSFHDIVTYRIVSANNHLLNTIFMKICTRFFGMQGLALRLPALFGYVCYLGAAYLISRRYLSRMPVGVSLVFFAFQPLLLTYFSLARGYAFGSGFMMMALYGLMLYIQKKRSSIYLPTLSSFMLGLAVLSNFCFAIPFLTFLCIITFLGMIDVSRSIKSGQAVLWQACLKLIFPVFAVSYLLQRVLLIPYLKLKAHGEFYFGGIVGLWPDTIKSVLETFLPFSLTPHLFTGIKFVSILLMSGLLLLFLIKTVRKSLSADDQQLFLVTIFLVAMAALISLLHFLLGLKYPIERTAIYFIPVFILFLLFIWQETCGLQAGTVRRAIQIFVAGVCILFLTRYTLNMKNASSVSSGGDTCVRQMMGYLIEMHKLDKDQKDIVRLGVHWKFEPVINYYRYIYDLKWLEPVNRGGPEGDFDYLYLFTNEYIRRQDTDERIKPKYDVTPLVEYPRCETYLAKPLPEAGAP